ncbi:uncharacterized protein LOC134092515 [Sardina pilchardus]|uniref:uncharacterized protein LOC134092515 n=1 Tax=Sardina pilchardus TaxID=27697 RepID=UPI002E103188
MATGNYVIKNKNVPGQTEPHDPGIFVLMYALYKTFGWAFDFTQNDIPLLRRWWCLVIINSMASVSDDPQFELLSTPVSPASVEQREDSDEDTTSWAEREEHLRELQVLNEDYQDTKWLFEEASRAADWLQKNTGIIPAGRYRLPRVLAMEAEEREEVMSKKFVQMDTEWMDLFTFHFANFEDHELFMVHVRDQHDIRPLTEFKKIK